MKALRFAASLALVAAIIAVYRLTPVNNTTVALTLLLAILGISTWWGLAEATLASVLAVLGFNFYFLPPVGKLTIQDPENLVAFLAFLVTATTASQLSARARRRTAEAEARRLESERLYALVRSLALTGNQRKTIREFLNRVVQEFGCRGAAFFYRETDEIFRTGPESQPVTDHDLRVAAEIEHASGEATAWACGASAAWAWWRRCLPRRWCGPSRTWPPSPSKRRAPWRKPATPKPRARASC
jgi:two-component system sensor histidine kinase KdpD